MCVSVRATGSNWVSCPLCRGVQKVIDRACVCPQSVKTTGSNGKTVYPVKAINVLKAHGKSARESALLNGYALNMGRASQGMPKRVANAKIACLDMNLQKARMHMGIQVNAGLHTTVPLVCSCMHMRQIPGQQNSGCRRAVNLGCTSLCHAQVFSSACLILKF